MTRLIRLLILTPALLGSPVWAGEPTSSTSTTESFLQRWSFDTKLFYHRVQAQHDIQITLGETPDSSDNHLLTQQLDPSTGDNVLFIDGAARFNPNSGIMMRLSQMHAAWDGKQLQLSAFPLNQIYDFWFGSNYGSWNTYNGDVNSNAYLEDQHGVYFTPNRAGTALMINFFQASEMGPNFSAILLRSDGEWNIFPPSYDEYIDLSKQKVTVLQAGGAALPKTAQKISFETVWNKRTIKLTLGVSPDTEASHTIQPGAEAGSLLIDGAKRWYDPQTPIQWKLTTIEAEWDGKAITLQNAPTNDFFNFPLSGYNMFEVMAGGGGGGSGNGVCIYPSIDGSAIYIGMARRDPTSGFLEYAVLVIDQTGRCDVFPPDLDSFKEDTGQYVKVLEGYSKQAAKAPANSSTP
jgi:hypothetical protein